MCNNVIGCWIFPNGYIHMTSNIESHIQSLMQIGINSQLLEFAKNIKWTDYEKEHFHDSDLPYIAFKCGYIRIMSFNDQIGIQCLCDIRNISSIQKNAIVDFLSSLTNTHIIKCITIEKFLSNDTLSFLALNDFLEYLN